MLIFGFYLKFVMMKTFLIGLLCTFIFATSCDTRPTNSAVEDRFSQNFKDRFVCKCIIRGLDSTESNSKIQALTYNDAESLVLYDKPIKSLLPKVMILIQQDSLRKVNTMAENAQGMDVYKICLDYSRSREMDSIILEYRKTWDTIKDVKKYVTDRFPY